jgi:hypothetical protein
MQVSSFMCLRITNEAITASEVSDDDDDGNNK